MTSVHPMFGPDTELLSGRHVLFLDVGCPEATTEAAQLFASTMAAQIRMDIEEHDRLIAYVLGLSHALNIAFFTALAESGETVPKLADISSTTFDAQLQIAGRVAEENPHLYFAIQAENPFGLAALEELRKAVTPHRRRGADGRRSRVRAADGAGAQLPGEPPLGRRLSRRCAGSAAAGTGRPARPPPR